MINNRIKILVLFVLFQLIFCAPVLAIKTIQVMALFNGKAVLKIDKAQRTLSLGQTSPEGVKLISADSEKALLEIAGKKKTYKIANATSIGTQFSQASELVAQAMADSRGFYFIQGSANGYPIRFLIDTGANTVAMNSLQADRLGIDYKLTGKQSFATTASGVAKAYAITLDKVKVGEIEIRNVSATVIEGGFPVDVLLGMSFLSNVTVERTGSLMQFKKTY